MNMPKVSVIIPSYNHEKYVAEAIQSVLDQTYQDFEIVVTDDASTDATADIVSKFSDKRIKLFRFDKNCGASVAANNCIANSSGEYIAMLSSDDVFYPDKLAKQVDFLDSNPQVASVLSYAQIIDDDGDDFKDDNHFYTRIFIQKNRTRFEWLNFFFFHGNCLCHPSALTRRDCYNKVGTYNSLFAQLPDFDFWIRLCTYYEIHILPYNLIKFRIRTGEANASARRPDTIVRTRIEHLQCLSNFLHPNIRDNLPQIFSSEVSDIPLDNLSPVEFEFIMYIIALSHGSLDIHKLWGLNGLYGILQRDVNVTEIVRKKFDFRPKDLIDLSGKFDPFNLLNVEHLHLQLQSTQNEISLMQRSKFWKMRNLWLKVKRKLGMR